MKRIYTLIICATLIHFSCDTEELEGEWINARTLNKSLDCSGWNIENLSVPESDPARIFTEKGLPEEYKTENLQLQLRIREPNEEEYSICHATGPGYPLKIIIEARE